MRRSRVLLFKESSLRCVSTKWEKRRRWSNMKETGQRGIQTLRRCKKGISWRWEARRIVWRRLWSGFKTRGGQTHQVPFIFSRLRSLMNDSESLLLSRSQEQSSKGPTATGCPGDEVFFYWKTCLRRRQWTRRENIDFSYGLPSPLGSPLASLLDSLSLLSLLFGFVCEEPVILSCYLSSRSQTLLISQVTNQPLFPSSFLDSRKVIWEGVSLILFFSSMMTTLMYDLGWNKYFYSLMMSVPQVDQREEERLLE